MAGNYSWHYMNTVYSASRYDQDAYEREISFVQSLQYLSDQQPLATLLLNSGPFEMEEAVDFGKRLDYVNTNGVSCLGMCVYIPGTVGGGGSSPTKTALPWFAIFLHKAEEDFLDEGGRRRRFSVPTAGERRGGRGPAKHPLDKVKTAMVK